MKKKIKRTAMVLFVIRGLNFFSWTAFLASADFCISNLIPIYLTDPV